MSKVTNSIQFKGEFSFLDMEIIETSKESIDTYDLKEYLKRFDGRNISILVKEENPAEPKQD